MNYKTKDNAPTVSALTSGQKIHGEIKTLERKLKAIKPVIESIRNSFPMGGERIEVEGNLIATISPPKTLTKLDKIALEAFIFEASKGQKTLASFEMLEKSLPGWQWIED